MTAPAHRSSSEQLPEDKFPPAPPPALRPAYLAVCRRYLAWCIGMLAWAILCVVYFVLTAQRAEMLIGIGLGVLLVLMIVLPALIFGGVLWYKRLGWITILLSLFSLMFVYPLVVVGIGITQRIIDGRYTFKHPPHATDCWHLGLSVLTIIITVWSIRVTLPALRLAQKLYRGELGNVQITETKPSEKLAKR